MKPPASHGMDILELQQWAFMPTLPDDITPIRNLLIRYSKIPAEDIGPHLMRIVSLFFAFEATDARLLKYALVA